MGTVSGFDNIIVVAVVAIEKRKALRMANRSPGCPLIRSEVQRLCLVRDISDVVAAVTVAVAGAVIDCLIVSAYDTEMAKRHISLSQ